MKYLCMAYEEEQTLNALSGAEWEALRVASRWPSARFGSIEVRPVDGELRNDRRYG